MRLMYDAITPARIPTTRPTMVAGYVDGAWPSHAEMVSRFPRARHVSIAVFASSDAQVLDVERFNATPAEAVGWAARQRARGQVPTVYCSTSTHPEVLAAFAKAGAEAPLWWEANYSRGPSVSPGAVAHQYQSTPGYDLSLVVDYWPGVDPDPIAHPPAQDKDEPMFIIEEASTPPKFWLVMANTRVEITQHAAAGLQAAGVIRPAFDETSLAAFPICK